MRIAHLQIYAHCVYWVTSGKLPIKIFEMNKLMDVSVYYDPGEKDLALCRLSNYVSELYHSNLK